MSEYSASSLDEQVQELADFINHEADEANRSVRLQVVLLAVVSIVLSTNFAVLSSQISKATEPEELAKQAAVLIDDNIPDIAGMIEEVMNDTTPQVALFISKQAVDEGVPYLTQRSEGFLSTYVDEMTTHTADKMDAAFNDIVTTHKESLREAIVTGQSGNEPSRALKPLRDQLHATFQDQTTGRPTEAATKVNKSLIALQNLNLRLVTLATAPADSLDRKQQMSARLLRIYWKWMTHTSPATMGEELPAKPKP